MFNQFSNVKGASVHDTASFENEEYVRDSEISQILARSQVLQEPATMKAEETFIGSSFSKRLSNGGRNGEDSLQASSIRVNRMPTDLPVIRPSPQFSEKMNLESALLKEITSIQDEASSKLMESPNFISADADKVKIICQVQHGEQSVVMSSSARDSKKFDYTPLQVNGNILKKT